MCTYTVKTKLCISNFDMFVKVVKDLTHALIWYAVAMLLLFVQGEYTVLPLLYLLCIWWNKAVMPQKNKKKKKKKNNSHLCSTRLQNRNLYRIFLDEVGSDQSGGILSPFMGTACLSLLYCCMIWKHRPVNHFFSQGIPKTNNWRVQLQLISIFHISSKPLLENWIMNRRPEISSVAGFNSEWGTDEEFTHGGRVTHICVSKLTIIWFR